MATLPEMQGDVYFGDAKKPLPDWREEPEDGVDEDTPLSSEEQQSVAAMIGFDPNDSEGPEEDAAA